MLSSVIKIGSSEILVDREENRGDRSMGFLSFP